MPYVGAIFPIPMGFAELTDRLRTNTLFSAEESAQKEERPG